MSEKTSLDVTGETFLCPYCQTWLEIPLVRTLLVNELKEKIMPADEGANVYDAAMKVIGELKAEIARKNEEIATLTEKYLRAGSINENLRDDNTILRNEIAKLKGKYPPIPDDFVEE